MTPIEVDVATVSQLLKDKANIYLLDCRQPSEAAVAAIEGAVLIPMNEIPAASDQLQAMAGKQVVVHCHHGGRSLRVAQWLRQNGFPMRRAWPAESTPGRWKSIPRYRATK